MRPRQIRYYNSRFSRYLAERSRIVLVFEWLELGAFAAAARRARDARTNGEAAVLAGRQDATTRRASHEELEHLPEEGQQDSGQYSVEAHAKSGKGASDLAYLKRSGSANPV